MISQMREVLIKWKLIKGFLELEKNEIFICIQLKEKEIKKVIEVKNE